MNTHWLATAPSLLPASGSNFPTRDRGFGLGIRLNAGPGFSRIGVLHAVHGEIHTPAFILVGTKANVKAFALEMLAALGAQAVLANAYHLYLQPGFDLVDEARGLGSFMNWPGPTYMDSGGFQVLSLGTGFKRVFSQEFSGSANTDDPRLYMQAAKASEVVADEDGVVFRSHIDGTRHRFAAEVSIRIQHELGSDIMFSFDELTSLLHPHSYQEESLERTHAWVRRCLRAHACLAEERVDKPYQQLRGVIQGAQYEDLRRKAVRAMAEMDEGGWRFDGFGLGSTLERENLGTILTRVSEELGKDRPRHLLGISEPEDFFSGVEAGADTFDCMNPPRMTHNAAIYPPDGRFNVTNTRFKRDFSPLVEGCGCYTCTYYSVAYVHHLFKVREMLASILVAIYNGWFIVRLADAIRDPIGNGDYEAFRDDMLGRYTSKGSPA